MVENIEEITEEVVSSEALELGEIFKRSNSDLEFVYIGVHHIRRLEDVNNIYFTTYQTVEDIGHIFYCKQTDEYDTFKWTVAERINQKMPEDELKKVINAFKIFPQGSKIKEAEFHINHLGFIANLPADVARSKSSIFYTSFFRELDAKNKIFLVFNWTGKEKFPENKKFEVFAIKLVDSPQFSFDYIPFEHLDKFPDFFKLDDVNAIIKKFEDVTNTSPGIMGVLSKSVKNKFYMEKIKAYQALKLGSIYLINEKEK